VEVLDHLISPRWLPNEPIGFEVVAVVLLKLVLVTRVLD
jgi:hypothetical protein